MPKDDVRVHESCVTVLIVFHQKIDVRGKTYKKKVSRSEITSTLKKKITSRSPLRFLGKCAGRNLIRARSLYPINDIIGQMFKPFSENFLLA